MGFIYKGYIFWVLKWTQVSAVRWHVTCKVFILLLLFLFFFLKEKRRECHVIHKINLSTINFLRTSTIFLYFILLSLFFFSVSKKKILLSTRKRIKSFSFTAVSERTELRFMIILLHTYGLKAPLSLSLKWDFGSWKYFYENIYILFEHR